MAVAFIIAIFKLGLNCVLFFPLNFIGLLFLLFISQSVTGYVAIISNFKISEA